MPDLKLSIKAVCKQTGLSPHVIRTWEKRYGTVKPVRSGGNQRLYSAGDIERLTLLRQATETGHSIGTIAALTTERLRSLVNGVPVMPRNPSVEAASLVLLPASGTEFARGASRLPAGIGTVGATDFLTQALEAVSRMDSEALERVLDRASVALGQVRLLGDLIVPLAEELGEAWIRGSLKVANEHVATAVLRTFLGNLSRPFSLHPQAPVLLITTPAGQIHELGALMAAATANGQGWRVLYCGASLPAEEIASAAIQNGVRAVGLSVVHPSDDPVLGGELRRLRRLLPAAVPVLVGGRASVAYQDQIEAAGAIRIASLAEFLGVLNSLRSNPHTALPA
jgi:DNA-binding transcriptional MerR regulator/methylmalonyl-CoA mutase cobalamin-binding subunit